MKHGKLYLKQNTFGEDLPIAIILHVRVFPLNYLATVF